jgi:hypothetical protein
MANYPHSDRASDGPGFISVTLGAVLGVALGVALAAVYLALKPVIQSTIPPEFAANSEVYFVPGAVNSAKARQWSRKNQLLSEGGPADILFCEEELNAWAASAIAKTPPGLISLVTPESVNFRITGGVLQIGLLGNVHVFDLSLPLVIQMRGKFTPGSAGFVFAAEELYIGSLPLHSVPGLPQWVLLRVLAAQQVPEGLTAMWRKLKLVAVEDNALHIIVP